MRWQFEVITGCYAPDLMLLTDSTPGAESSPHHDHQDFNGEHWPNKLQSQSPGDFHPYQIVPSCPQIRGGAGEGPELEALRIHLGKVSQTLHHPNWVRVKSRFASVKMLNHVK